MASALKTVNRIVTSHVPKTPLHANIVRLVGGLDCKGNGTDHPLLSVDPFVLCDAAPNLPGAGLPPFGFHPHYGLIAMTYVLDGAFDDEDNLAPVGQRERHINQKGSFYMVSSGRGVRHSEKSVDEGNNGTMQTIVRIPRDKLHLPPQISRATAEELPLIEQPGGGTIKLLTGRLNGVESPASVDAMPRMVLTYLEVSSGGTLSVPLDQDLDHGFAYVLKGGTAGEDGTSVSSTIGGTNVIKDGGVYLFESGNNLELTNPEGAEPMHVFLGAGSKLDMGEDASWVKLLGGNGFIIAKDMEEAETIMAKIEQVGDDFTYKSFSD